MAMKQPTLVSLHFKNLSNDQDKLSQSTSGENTDTCLLSFPDTRGPKKHCSVMFHFNETTE